MRNFLAGLGGGTGAFAAAAVCAAMVVAGFWVQSQRNKPAEPAQLAAVPQADGQAEPAPATAVEEVETAQADSAAPTPVETEAPAPLPAPSFDEVRREADGMTVIAGRGAPGAVVHILQDGAEVARAQADGSGRFATLAMIPPDGRGHVLTLLQELEGVETASDAEIILAPLAPAVVAQADDPAAKPAPTTVAEDTPAPTGTSDSTIAIAEDTDAPVATGVAEVAEDPVETADAGNSAAEVRTAKADTQATSDPAVDSGDAAAAVVQQTAQDDPTGQQAAPTSGQTAKVAGEASQAPAENPTAVAVLKSTRDGVALLNTPAPEAMTNVAIDTISYSDLGAVELSGRAQARASSVRVYLDNRSIVSLPVDPQGRWRGELPEVDEGIYTLRVDEVAEDGAVTSRVETPFKREDTEVLAAAAAAQEGLLKAITVQKGATLWAIARERYGDGQLYVRVFEANAAAIRDPDLIYPGQIFDLPD